MDLAPFDGNGISVIGKVCGIVLQCAFKGCFQRVNEALVCPLIGLFHGHIVPVCQETRKIRLGEGFQFTVIKGLDGIHVVIGHFGRCVHGNLFEGQTSRTFHPVMVG